MTRRALDLHICDSALGGNTHLQQGGTLNPTSSGRLRVVRFDLIATEGTG
jgi:hypothetical protein